MYQGEYQQSYAYSVMKELLEKEVPLTAVITCNNSLGKGYLQAVYEADQVNVFTHVGLDKIEMLELLRIPDNYIIRDSCEMGKQAAEMLISRIAFPPYSWVWPCTGKQYCFCGSESPGACAGILQGSVLADGKNRSNTDRDRWKRYPDLAEYRGGYGRRST